MAIGDLQHRFYGAFHDSTYKHIVIGGHPLQHLRQRVRRILYIPILLTDALEGIDCGGSGAQHKDDQQNDHGAGIKISKKYPLMHLVHRFEFIADAPYGTDGPAIGDALQLLTDALDMHAYR